MKTEDASSKVDNSISDIQNHLNVINEKLSNIDSNVNRKQYDYSLELVDINNSINNLNQTLSSAKDNNKLQTTIDNYNENTTKKFNELCSQNTNS